MGNELELEGLLPDEDEKMDFQSTAELSDEEELLSERWSSWVNVINR